MSNIPPGEYPAEGTASGAPYDRAQSPQYQGGGQPPQYQGGPAVGGAPQFGAPPAYGAQSQYAGRRNPLALTSLILGIISIPVAIYGIVGLVALILGIVGRRQIAARGERGRGMATAGIILGIIGIIVGILSIFVLGAAMQQMQGQG